MERQTHQGPEQPGITLRPVVGFRVGVGYLVALAVIFGVTTCAWLILGGVTARRTSRTDSELRSKVGRLWGGEHRQAAPHLQLHPNPVTRPVVGPVARAAEKPVLCAALPRLSPARTRARAQLALQHRRKGLLWYSTYRVRFHASYTFENPTECPQEGELALPLPAYGAIYDEFRVTVGGEEVAPQMADKRARTVLAPLRLGPGQRREVVVSYNSRGLDRWSYAFGDATSRARDFELSVLTNFHEVDFPDGTLAPTHKRRTAEGWQLTWRFGNILADTDVAVGMPARINPGPLAAQIALFAPVSLGFFFFVLLLVSVLKQIKLHPLHYAMLAAAFFSFHLLLAYLVDLVPLWLAFTVAAVASVGLVVSYLRLVVGARFALLWAGGAQLLYLVLFSLAFFLEGYTGLTITIFSVLTLFVVMQMTGRIDWSSYARAGAGGEPGAGQAEAEAAAPEQAFGHVG